MQIDYVNISCKEDVHICRTNFAIKMEQNSHETTSRWKTYGKQLFSENLEVRCILRCMLTKGFKNLKMKWDEVTLPKTGLSPVGIVNPLGINWMFYVEEYSSQMEACSFSHYGSFCPNLGPKLNLQILCTIR
jgi:hypothetical protein